MDREEAQTLLNAKLDEYRQLSYDQLATRVGDEEFPEIAGREENPARKYRPNSTVGRSNGVLRWSG